MFSRRGEVISLWDMYELYAADMYNLSYAIEYFVKQTEKGEWTPAVRTDVKRGLQNALPRIEMLCPPGAKELFSRTISQIDSMNLQTAKVAALHLRHRVNDDFKGLFFLFITDPKYYSKPNLFGESVFNAFSSVTGEIEEAGKCLALERGTACVFHLMRIVEAGLAALAKRLRISPQKSWGAYLQKIDHIKMQKPSPPIWFTRNEEFFIESAIRIGSVKDAWRNPTIHHLERTYTVEQAKEIFSAIQSLMRHLATKLRA